MARGESSTTSTTRAADGAAGEVRDGRGGRAGREARGEGGKAPRKRRAWLRALVAVVAVLVLVAGVLASLFAWDRWYRYDDAADIQGRWYPAGSTSPVEIGPDTMTFGTGLDAEYAYTIDTREKTLAYTLGPLEGKGRYWFADGRSALVIEDGDFTASDTALADLGRLLAGLDAAIDGTAPALPEGDGISAFTREVDPAVAAAKAEAERQARAAEEAARRAEEDAPPAEREAIEAGGERAADGEGEEADGSEGPGDPDAGAEDATRDDADPDSGAAGEAAKKPDRQPQDFSNESMGILE